MKNEKTIKRNGHLLTYKIANIVTATLNKDIDVFVQGCNCFCGFGRGLAEEVLERIPDAYYKADKLTKAADKSKLGTYSFVEIDNGAVVVNAYTQYHYIRRKNNEPKVKNGRGYVLANYDAIRSVMQKIAIEYPDKHIGVPKIAAGWANGDWEKIQNIIVEELISKGVKVTFYVQKESEIPL
jgi:O-acetyl-ADP-ribose deacetylase (regulator of RNase III)